MKRNFLFVTLALVALSQSGFAAPRSVAATGANRPTYLGFAVDQIMTGSATPGLSAYMMMGDTTALQLYLGMGGISPSFSIGGGASLKCAVVGDAAKGLHAGAGVGLGLNTGNFFVNVGAIGGLHFELVDRVMINLDGGLALAITTPGTVNLTLGAFSPNFGASILMRL